MSLSYCHTLIPISTEFTPSAAQVRVFLSAMVLHEVVGGEPSIILRTPSKRVRQGVNPFTGKVVSFGMQDTQRLQEISQVADVVAANKNYQVEVSGTGRPKTAPMPLDFNGPYHVGVTCRVSSALCQTSDLHEESGLDPALSFYGGPLDWVEEVGVFNNPHTMEVIKVAGAGCARFWIEFALGKLLFPSFDRNDLQFLNPVIVAEAEKVFGMRFVQGCHWG
jgi:hypothetical protein